MGNLMNKCVKYKSKTWNKEKLLFLFLFISCTTTKYTYYEYGISEDRKLLDGTSIDVLSPEHIRCIYASLDLLYPTNKYVEFDVDGIFTKITQETYDGLTMGSSYIFYGTDGELPDRERVEESKPILYFSNFSGGSRTSNTIYVNGLLYLPYSKGLLVYKNTTDFVNKKGYTFEWQDCEKQITSKYK